MRNWKRTLIRLLFILKRTIFFLLRFIDFITVFSYTHLNLPAHSVPLNGKILNLLFIAYYLFTNYSLVYNIIRILPAINSLTVTQLPSNYPHPRGYTRSVCVIGNWLFFISIIFHLADPYDRRKENISPCCEEIILQFI